MISCPTMHTFRVLPSSPCRSTSLARCCREALGVDDQCVCVIPRLLRRESDIDLAARSSCKCRAAVLRQAAGDAYRVYAQRRGTRVTQGEGERCTGLSYVTTDKLMDVRKIFLRRSRSSITWRSRSRGAHAGAADCNQMSDFFRMKLI